MFPSRTAAHVINSPRVISAQRMTTQASNDSTSLVVNADSEDENEAGPAISAETNPSNLAPSASETSAPLDSDPFDDLGEKNTYFESLAGAQLAGMHYQKGEYEEAVAILEQLTQMESTNEFLRIMLAYSYTKIGNHTMAIYEWTGIVDEQPSNAEFVQSLAGELQLYNHRKVQIDTWNYLAERHSSILQFQNFLVAAYEDETRKHTASVFVSDPGSELALRMRSPYNLDNDCLFKSLYNTVDQFYTAMDKLENSGFGLGQDILPDISEMKLADLSMVPLFTGDILSQCN